MQGVTDVEKLFLPVWTNDSGAGDGPGIFERLRETLLTHGDFYMHLADLKSFCEAQERLGELYAQPDAWARKAILNVAGLREILQRAHHRRIRGGYLEGETMPSELNRLSRRVQQATC